MQLCSHKWVHICICVCVFSFMLMKILSELCWIQQPSIVAQHNNLSDDDRTLFSKDWERGERQSGKTVKWVYGCNSTLIFFSKKVLLLVLTQRYFLQIDACIRMHGCFLESSSKISSDSRLDGLFAYSILYTYIRQIEWIGTRIYSTT